MSLLASLKGKGPSGFGYGSTADDVTNGLDLSGQTILVTGCNAGLGHETVRALAARGARIIGTGRTKDKALVGCAGIKGNPLALACELSDPSSVRRCIAAIEEDGARLDAIICNAGIMALPRLQQACGYELQFFTNHIGHFILVTGLLERLTDAGRVVVLSSGAHNAAPKQGIELDNLSGSKGYRPWRAYAQSKLANLLFAKELARRLSGTGRTANAVHPGVIQTNLARSMPAVVRLGLSLGRPLFLKTIPEGAATSCYVATSPTLRVSGEYFADCNVARSSSLSHDMNLAARLWHESERIVGTLPS